MQNGSAMLMWQMTCPVYNDCSLLVVLSMNWSGKTRCPGFISSRSEPTAVGARMCVAPSSLSAQMLAR